MTIGEYDQAEKGPKAELSERVLLTNRQSDFRNIHIFRPLHCSRFRFLALSAFQVVIFLLFLILKASDFHLV